MSGVCPPGGQVSYLCLKKTHSYRQKGKQKKTFRSIAEKVTEEQKGEVTARFAGSRSLMPKVTLTGRWKPVVFNVLITPVYSACWWIG